MESDRRKVYRYTITFLPPKHQNIFGNTILPQDF